ncbi:acyltransferase family protein [Siccibacter turicensis]|uniref:acyltransferase family protein n=1 Tax=Siccibacter turicensis TaxID=357233 RepID=UPI0039C911A9
MTRDPVIDALRFIGLMLIILAHVSPPEFLFQIRTFDVPLMVFVSGLSYYISVSNDYRYSKYVKARFIRLVLPVWVFFTIFYFFCFAFDVQVFKQYLNAKTVLSTFILSGFGYVWIIRVFLIIAIISPLLIYFTSKRSYVYDLAFITALILTSETLNYFSYFFNNKYLLFLIKEVIINALSYSVLFILGFKWRCYNLTQKFKVYGFILFTLLMLVGLKMKLGGDFNLQNYKYPPQIFYITYSVFMTCTLYLALEYYSNRNRTVFSNNKILCFMSSNSIWIYLWHIPVVEYFKLSGNEWEFYKRYVLVIIVSVFIAYIQVTFIKSVFKQKTNVSRVINKIFTG